MNGYHLQDELFFKICKDCGQNKPLTKEYFATGTNKRGGKIFPYFYLKCKICTNKQSLEKNRNYKSKNRKALADKQKEYHLIHKENDAITKRKWYEDNKEYCREKARIDVANKRKTVSFKLKCNISSIVRSCISKNRQSIKNYLPYSLDDLKCHLESLFEPWMNWDNYGVYRVDSWDDNNRSTWTWQIDHIIPHSNFNYSSMEDTVFKDCWALSNLRPYSSKQNILEGNRNRNR